MSLFVMKHDWNFGPDCCGHYEMTFESEKEARNYFDYYKSLIEADEYNFDVKFSPFCEGDNKFSAYEDVKSSFNRQDLVLEEVHYEVSC